MHGKADAAACSQALMSVRGLGIRFKTSHGVWQATRKIDFDIAPGERVGIVGESGCGKTITGLSILRLLPNNLAGLDGSIHVRRHRSRQMPAPRRCAPSRGRRIAMIFQEPMSALDPVFTVGHQIAETLRVHTGVGKEEARSARLDMLRRVGIASPERRIDDYPHQLSGGMRQRVMIAAGADLRAATPDRGRADHRARRHRAGADPGTAARPQRDLEHGADADHARPRRRRRDLHAA